MPVLAALLALALAAAPTLAPTADNDAIHAEIAACDPRLTNPPASLERLLAAVTLAEERLGQAADSDAVSDALTLTVAGHRVAYRRTGEARHLCLLIAAADRVLAGDGVSPGLEAAATDFRQEARDTLGVRACEAPPPQRTADLTANTTAPAATEGPVPPPARRIAPPPIDPADRRRVRAGVGTLVPGLLLFAPMVGLLAYRADVRRELVGINTDTKVRPATATETARVTELDKHHVATTTGAVALGVTGAALVVTGAVLLATGGRPNRVAVAPWGGRASGRATLAYPPDGPDPAPATRPEAPAPSSGALHPLDPRLDAGSDVHTSGHDRRALQPATPLRGLLIALGLLGGRLGDLERLVHGWLVTTPARRWPLMQPVLAATLTESIRAGRRPRGGPWATGATRLPWSSAS